MNKTKFSIVTVCYNAVNEIEKTILSVLNQTYDDIEYIIIDGGSKDGTVDIIKKYSDRISYWISEPDRGIYDAMNKGIIVATGDYINFMNAGDSFCATDIITTIAKNLTPETGVIFGDCFYVKENQYNKTYIPALDISKLPKKYPFCHQSTFTKTSYIKKNLFDTSFKICADWNFFRNAYLVDKIKFVHISEPICNFDTSSGMSRDNINLLYEEKYRCLGIENSYLKKFKYECMRIMINLKNRIFHN